MKVRMRFTNGFERFKELPKEMGLPEKFMFHELDSELMGYIAKLDDQKQIGKMGNGIMFQLTPSEDITPLYVETP